MIESHRMMPFHSVVRLPSSWPLLHHHTNQPQSSQTTTLTNEQQRHPKYPNDNISEEITANPSIKAASQQLQHYPASSNSITTNTLQPKHPKLHQQRIIMPPQSSQTKQHHRIENATPNSQTSYENNRKRQSPWNATCLKIKENGHQHT